MELANNKQNKELKQWYSQNTSIDPNHKIQAVKKIFDDLNIQNLTGETMTGYFERSLAHLDSVHADATRKDHLRLFATQLFNRTY